MLFLANENIPQDSIDLLRSNNVNVISIKEEYRGISDLSVIQLAIEKNAIILTFDKDYGEIIFHSQFPSPPSVIFFRFKGYHSLFAAETLLDLLQNELLKFNGFFTVIEEDNARQRKL